MKRLLILALAISSLASLHAADPAKTAPAADEVAVIKTTDGTMVAEFFTDAAPNTVANFIKLAKSGFYDGTAFHRIIPGFMAQGGDPLTKDLSKEDAWGTGGPGYSIKDEFNAHKHVRGVLSMAHTSEPDSGGSQFFLMLGTAEHLDGAYSAFGQLIKGDDVLDKIAATPLTTAPNGEPSKPTKRVEIKSIKIVPRSSVK